MASPRVNTKVLRDAYNRQGTEISFGERILRIPGGSSAVEFPSGREGLVQLAIDIRTGEKFRIKCFWNPDDRRRRRSEYLASQQLPNPKKYKADALGGAPMGILFDLGPSTPFALVMRNIRGEKWEKLKGDAQIDKVYPPQWWPPVSVRATWAYGLATAVKQLEEREFIHSDLSLGNVMLSDGIHGLEENVRHPYDEFAGDMALVDFDRYIHKEVELPEQGQGSQGYAAKEVWEGKKPELGSDRTSMAILIQEFLVTGDPEVSREEVFDWVYDQSRRTFGISSGQDESQSLFRVHPLLAKKYPVLAGLVEDTVRAVRPLGRPEPKRWRDALRPIAEASPATNAPRVSRIAIEEIMTEGTGQTPYRLALAQAMRTLNLAQTLFKIRATLNRDDRGSIFLSVNDGGSIEVKYPGNTEWTACVGNARMEVKDGMEVRDKTGLKTARISEPR